MICRADLALEIPAEKIFVAQKWMIEKANFVAKPVMVTQQVFESMMRNTRPTRAEAADVAASVVSGVDCICLEDETSYGDYPANAVTMLSKCVVEAENTMDFKKEFNDVKLFCPAPEGSAESVALAAVNSTLDLDVQIIVIDSNSTALPRLVARYKPEKAVVVCSSNVSIIR